MTSFGLEYKYKYDSNGTLIYMEEVDDEEGLRECSEYNSDGNRIHNWVKIGDNVSESFSEYDMEGHMIHYQYTYKVTERVLR